MKDKRLQVRIGGREDLPLLFEICKNQTREEFCLWGADFVYDYPPDLRQMEESFKSRRDTVFYAAEVSGRMVGFAEITGIEKEKKKGILARIVLDKHQRGKGFGKAFVQEIVRRAVRELELEEILLVVYSHNQRARKCYESCGFQYEKEVIRPGRPDALQMKINAKELKMELKHNFDEAVIRRGTDAKKYNPAFYPEDVLPMWIADTDFKCPQPVIDAIMERMAQGVYGYPHVSEEFKKAIARWERVRFGWKIPASAVEFVPGVIPGVICAVRALSHPGDNIVINTPCYPPFKDLSDHNGRHLLRNELKVVNGQYSIDFEDLEEKLSDVRSRLFILCNPQNPTGRVFTLEELKRIGELCLKHNVFVLVDEIHCDLVYKGYRHIPFASICEEFAQNSITFVNASKTFNTAGFRTAGFICLNPAVKAAVHEAVLDNKGIGENLGGTVATIAAYTKCDYYADQMMEYLEGNLDLVCRELEKTNGKVKLIRPEGTYLLWLDCRGLGMNQKELVDFFVNKVKVGFNSGTGFGPEGAGFMRMNIATQRAVVEEALRRIIREVNAL